MKKTEYRILTLFKENPDKEYSTSEIVKHTFPEQIAEIESLLKQESYDKNREKQFKQKNAQLHRKTLYYLNRLIGEGILGLAREGSKGEKFFGLALAQGEQFIIDKYKRRIIIEKPIIPAMPVEGYEQKGFLYRFEPETWVERLNAILLESGRFNDLTKFYHTIIDCFSNVNDAIALNEFETLVKNNTSPNINSFLTMLNSACADYGKKITCIINLTNSDEKTKSNLVKLLNISKDIEHINFVFDMRAKELREYPQFFDKIVETFSRNRLRLYIKNQDIHPAPYIIGSMGPYTLDPNEWQIYKEDLQKTSNGLACAQSCITIDVFRFFDHHKTADEFHNLVMAVTKALLTANSLQRRKSNEFFKNLTRLMPNFFIFSRNYIRFWNYGWKQPGVDTTNMWRLIQSTKEEVHNFASSQETIYLSCGMPTRFKVAFSCVFRSFDDRLSKAHFAKLKISKPDDLHSTKIKNIIIDKEKIFEVFDGGDRMRFLRVGTMDLPEVLREVNIILTGYKLPFFCYDFGETSKDIKLSEFI